MLRITLLMTLIINCLQRWPTTSFSEVTAEFLASEIPEVVDVIRDIDQRNYNEAALKMVAMSGNGTNQLYIMLVVGDVYQDRNNYKGIINLVTVLPDERLSLVMIEYLLRDMKYKKDVTLTRNLELAALLRRKVKVPTEEFEKLLKNIHEECVSETSSVLSRAMISIKQSIPVTSTRIKKLQTAGNLMYKYDIQLLERAIKIAVEEMYTTVGPWIVQNVVSSFKNPHEVIVGCKVSFTRLRRAIRLKETTSKETLWHREDGNITEMEEVHIQNYSRSLRAIMKQLVDEFFPRETDRANLNIVSNFTRDPIERTATALVLKHTLKAMRQLPEFSNTYRDLVDTIRKETRMWIVEDNSDFTKSVEKSTERVLLEMGKELKVNDTIPLYTFYNARQVIDWAFIFCEDLMGKAINEAIQIIYNDFGPFVSLKIITDFNIFAEVLIGLKRLFFLMKRNDDVNTNIAILPLAHTLHKIESHPLYKQVPLRYRQDISDTENLSDIRKTLPLSVRNIAFSNKVCIRNNALKKYLAIDTNVTFDKFRRPITFFKPGDEFTNRVWIVERYALFTTKYYIRNEASGEYLLVSVIDYDQDRRRLFTWTSGSKIKSSIFYFEPHFDNIAIRNSNHNEYVVAGEVPEYGSVAFTMKKDKRSDTFKDHELWVIESCD